MITGTIWRTFVARKLTHPLGYLPCVFDRSRPLGRSEVFLRGYENINLARHYTPSTSSVDGPAISQLAKPSEEMQDVTAIDQFMNVVRASDIVHFTRHMRFFF